MHTKIHSEFWSDPDIEPQPRDVKYAALWLMTNERVNLLGCAEVTEKKFAYDTGLAPEALGKALKALPKTFQRYGEGSYSYWIRNYIRYQIGEGDSLLRNNMFKPLARAWQGLRNSVLQQQILQEYPEFDCCRPEASPSQGLGDSPEAQEQSRAERSRAEQRSTGGGPGEDRATGKGIPRGIDEVIAYFLELGSTDQEARKFHDHFTANGWKQAGRAAIKDWKAAARNWVRRSGEGGGPGGKIKPGGSGPDAPFDPKQPNAHTGGVRVAN